MEQRADGDSMTAPLLALSVIISSYNTRVILQDCLRSLYQNPPSEPHEVIVVDDASTDGTSEMVQAEFPDVRLMINERNRHYAFSNNRAFDAARGKYLFLLNSDTIVLPGAIDGMLTFLEEHQEAGGVGCKLLNADETTQWSIKALPDLGAGLFGARSVITLAFPNNRYSRRRLLHLHQDMTKPFVVEGYISSAAKMMPASVVKEVGYLDERLAYHVDADYCKRIVDAGYPCYCLPTVAIIHLNHKGGTMANTRTRFYSLFLFHRQSYVYYRKHILKSAMSPVAIFVLFGIAAHYLAYVAVQSATEVLGAARSHLQLRKSTG